MLKKLAVFSPSRPKDLNLPFGMCAFVIWFRFFFRWVTSHSSNHGLGNAAIFLKV
jgi:hypothetical protein